MNPVSEKDPNHTEPQGPIRPGLFLAILGFLGYNLLN
jgi:hypothetical protein